MVEISSARSSARAAVAGEASAAARADDLSADLECAKRNARDAEIDAETRVADVNDAMEVGRGK